MRLSSSSASNNTPKGNGICKSQNFYKVSSSKLIPKLEKTVRTTNGMKQLENSLKLVKASILGVENNVANNGSIISTLKRNSRLLLIQWIVAKSLGFKNHRVHS